MSAPGGGLLLGGVCSQGGCVCSWGGGVSAARGGGLLCSEAATPSPEETATAADGTHPTGMHSC